MAEPSEASVKDIIGLFKKIEKPKSSDADTASTPTISGGSSTLHSAHNGAIPDSGDKEENSPRKNRMSSVGNKIKAFQGSPSTRAATLPRPSSSSTKSTVPHSTLSGRSGESPGVRNRQESADGVRRKEIKQLTRPVDPDQSKFEVQGSIGQSEIYPVQLQTLEVGELGQENGHDIEHFPTHLRTRRSTSVDPCQSKTRDQLLRENEDLRRQLANYNMTNGTKLSKEKIKEEQRTSPFENFGKHLSQMLQPRQAAAKEGATEAAAKKRIAEMKQLQEQLEQELMISIKSKNDEIGLMQAEVNHLSEEILAKTQQVKEYEQDSQQRQAELEVEVNRLSEEILAKAQQVKGYKQQADSYKVRLEESQRELQSQVESSRQRQAVVNQLQRTLREMDARLKQAEAHLLQREPVKHPRNNERSLNRYVVQPRQPIKFDRKIGEGCYGSVYAINLDGTPCIAKRLQDILMGRNREEAVSQETKENFHRNFFRECVLMSQTNHPNIVKFIGVHYGQDKFDLTLILERLSTDLQRFLTRGANIPLSTKVSILRDVSCGLLYLHERSIIHRDLTAGNVLLTVDSQAKIADLGVSRIFDRSLLELSKLPGTLGYMPPEALKDRPVYNESIDIFSFGVLALYVAVQEFPEFSWSHVPDAIMTKGEGEIYKRSSQIDKMNTKQPELSSLVLWCLQDDPMKRPSTFCLNILLNEMRRELNDH